MATWVFATDLHGRIDRYEALWAVVDRERPHAVLLGGDLLPNGLDRSWRRALPGEDFVLEWLAPRVDELRRGLGPSAPDVLLIPGNDDERRFEASFRQGEDDRLWTWAHGRRVAVGNRDVLGYGCVPPTPFALKDWERYDVSRSVDPGCVPPDEGVRTVAVDVEDVRWGTIAKDLDAIVGDRPVASTVCLFHAPPYRTCLDRAGLDGILVDHVQVDVHVGSIAVRRFVETRAPAAVLCGHVHEAARITGEWRERVGTTWCLGGAWDGPELCVVRLDPDRPEAARRELITP
jgi:Icc-related predicted phosphoesterase